MTEESQTTSGVERLLSHVEALDKQASESMDDDFFCMAVVPPGIQSEQLEKTVKSCHASLAHREGQRSIVFGRVQDVAKVQDQLTSPTECREAKVESISSTKEKASSPKDAGPLNKDGERQTLRSSKRSRAKVCYVSLAGRQHLKEEKQEEEEVHYGTESGQADGDAETIIEASLEEGDENTITLIETDPAEVEVLFDEKTGSREVKFIKLPTKAEDECKSEKRGEEGEAALRSPRGRRQRDAASKKEPMLTCDVCLMTFQHEHQALFHRKRHFDDEGRLTKVAQAACLSMMKKRGLSIESLNPEIRSQLTVDIKKKMLPFTCAECGAGFQLKKLLAKHKCSATEKDGQSGMQCPHCNFTAPNMQTFVRHVKSHLKPAVFKCDQCDYSNAMKSEVNRHKRNAHAEKTIQCSLCTTKFRNKILLNQHIKQKHLKVYMKICEICGKNMQSAAYKDHYRAFHGPDSGNRKKYICSKCGRVLQSKRAYDNHMQTAHAEINPEEEEVAQSLTINEEERSSCKLCGFSARYAKTVVRHIIAVHAERKHACSSCGAAFAREKLLQRHVDIFHKKLEMCACSVCNRTFHSASHLKGHMQRMHSASSQYTCTVCNKGFLQLNQLQQHLRIHLLDNAVVSTQIFLCKICDALFESREELVQHCLSEHPSHRLCQQCGQQFEKQEAAESHACPPMVISDPRYNEQIILGLNSNSIEHQKGIFFCTVCDSEVTNTSNEHTCLPSGNFVCMACGSDFASNEEAECHECPLSVPVETSVSTPASEPFSSNGVKEEEGEEDVPVFLCGICSQLFESEDAINQHLMEHNNEQIAVPLGTEESTQEATPHEDLNLVQSSTDIEMLASDNTEDPWNVTTSS